MLTRSLLRGCSAFIAFFALCLSATSGGRAQDILKELEQADHEAAKKPAGHNHEHHAAPGSKKRPVPRQIAFALRIMEHSCANLAVRAVCLYW